VHYHGFHPVGPRLSAFYRQADIYVLASHRESFPRTIWEAMAHGLPVVASAAGSIPVFLRQNETARLAEPANVDSLMDAILAVAGQPRLRRHLIHNGYALARQNTLECRTRELVEALTSWVARQQRHTASRANKPTVP
jgi:glycosyltransferase involved in cell wall biosynthesis